MTLTSAGQRARLACQMLPTDLLVPLQLFVSLANTDSKLASLCDQMSSTGLKPRKISAYTAVKVDPDGDYCTPGAFDLERLFWKGSAKYTHVNEVWPNLYIGDE